MANTITPDRINVGSRLKAAREAIGLSQTVVATRFGLNKGTISAWETGRGDPGIYRLRELAKLYKVSAESLLWDEAPSDEAMQLAAQFDALSERKRQTLRALWSAFIADSKEDSEVEKAIPTIREMQQRNYTTTEPRQGRQKNFNERLI